MRAMGSDGHDSTTRMLAAAFREVLEEARWEPDQDFGPVMIVSVGTSNA